MESYEDWLVYDLKNLPSKRAELAATDNPYMREYLTRHIADMERLLNALDDRERYIIVKLVIDREREGQIAELTGIPVGQIRKTKENAIEHLLRLRYGARYSP